MITESFETLVCVCVRASHFRDISIFEKSDTFFWLVFRLLTTEKKLLELEKGDMWY